MKLWERLKELKVVDSVLEVIFQFPQANVMHNLFEKLILYALNRAINDFHPFWSNYFVNESRLVVLLN